MSDERHETVADIVAEMRRIKCLTFWADRIEEAMRHQFREVSKLRKENNRLRAALKPVLDAYISQDDMSKPVYDSRIDAAVCVCAVREAKRLYNEGEENQNEGGSK